VPVQEWTLAYLGGWKGSCSCTPPSLAADAEAVAVGVPVQRWALAFLGEWKGRCTCIPFSCCCCGVGVAVAVVVPVQRWALAYPGRGGAVALPFSCCCCGGRGGGSGVAGAGGDTSIPWWLGGVVQLHPPSLAAAAEEQPWRWGCRCRGGHWHSLGGEVQLHSLSLAAAAVGAAVAAVGLPVQRWARAFLGEWEGRCSCIPFSCCCCGGCGGGGGGGDAGAGVDTGIPWWLGGEVQLDPPSLAAAAADAAVAAVGLPVQRWALAFLGEWEGRCSCIPFSCCCCCCCDERSGGGGGGGAGTEGTGTPGG
jgi:hypothetical protein